MIKVKIYAVFLLGVIHLSAQGQDTAVTYYDKNWEVCAANRAVFFGKRYQDANKISHSDDYYISGKIQMTGTYLKKNYKKKNGVFTWYYENGQTEYAGNYVKDKRVGEWIWWSDSGQVEKKLIYNDKGLLHGAATFWFDNGQLNCEGYYVDGKFDGVWKYYHQNGQECSRETYIKGQLVALELWNEAGEPEKVTSLQTEIDPQFPGGESALFAFIKENVVYPEQARKNLIEGVVYIEFVVGLTGAIEDIEVMKPVHPLLDEEALRVIGLMPAWSPGKQHNRAVRVRYTIPIRFTIT